MRKIPWWIWLAVIFGWLAGATASDYSHNGPLSWLLGVLVIVISYYCEKLTKLDK